MQKSITWYKDDGKIITDVTITKEGEKPEGEGWKQSLVKNITAETSLNWYEIEKGTILRKLSNEEYLKKQGKEDPRGVWYDKQREKSDIMIYNIDSSPPGDDYTKIPPILDEPYQFFDEKNKKWVADQEKKILPNKKGELGRLKSEIEEAERKQYRSMKALALKKDIKADRDKFDEYEAIIEELRPQVAALENEIEELEKEQEPMSA